MATVMTSSAGTNSSTMRELSFSFDPKSSRFPSITWTVPVLAYSFFVEVWPRRRFVGAAEQQVKVV